MANDLEHPREFLRDSYLRGILANYERLSVSPSESVRFEALCRLAGSVGFLRVMIHIYDLACEAKSDRIALRANNVLADYFGVCTDASAEDRPEPIKFDLEEQLTVEQLHPDNRDANRRHRGAIEFIKETVYVPQQPPPANVSPPPAPRPPPTIPQAWREDWPAGKRPKNRPQPDQPQDQPQGAQPKEE